MWPLGIGIDCLDIETRIGMFENAGAIVRSKRILRKAPAPNSSQKIL